MFAAVTSTPHTISVHRLGELRERYSEYADRQRCAADDPFALDTIGKGRGQERRDRIGKGDNDGVLHAFGNGNALFDHQRGHSIRKAIEAEGLAEVEHHEDHDQRKVRRLEKIRKANFGGSVRWRCRDRCRWS
jgi:hypothetical protein